MDTDAESKPVVTLGQSAAEEVKALGARKEKAGKVLRVFNEKDGCSGMQYSMVFDRQHVNDVVVEVQPVAVVLDPFSSKSIQGAEVDFNDDLTGGGFKTTHPSARQTCGCGKSFEA